MRGRREGLIIGILGHTLMAKAGLLRLKERLLWRWLELSLLLWWFEWGRLGTRVLTVWLAL